MNIVGRISTISAITLGCVVAASYQDTNVKADQNYYVNNSTNSNAAIPKLRASNGMNSYDDSSTKNVASTAPNVVYNGKFNKTTYDLNQQNPSHSYEDQEKTNTFNTYYYLPNGYNIDKKEYGNYQSTVRVGDDMYVLESLGNNNGAIIHYNTDDLKSIGVLNSNGSSGDGRDLIWKAYTYTSPYTKDGQQNTVHYVNYHSYLTDADDSQKDAQNGIKNAQAQLASDEQDHVDYQKAVEAEHKVAQQFVDTTERELIQQNRFNKKITKRLTVNNYLSYFNQIINNASNEVDKINTKRTKLKQQIKQLADYEQLKKHNLLVKLTRIDQKKQLLKSTVAFNQHYVDQFNRTYGKKLNIAKQDLAGSNDLLTHDQQAITTAQQTLTTTVQAVQALENLQQQYSKYQTIMNAAHVSPMLNIGHGEGMAYNPVTKNLYLVQDDTLSDLKANGANSITELDPVTFNPIKQFDFPLFHGGGNYSIHTLTFDSTGNVYFGRKQSATNANGQNSYPSYQIFKGSMDENSGAVSFSLVPQTINWGGYSNQDISYDAFNNRMYIISDNIITSVPADKLANGTVQPADVHYLSFDINREFEDLTFDNQGYGYLLTLWNPEIMKTSLPID